MILMADTQMAVTWMKHKGVAGRMELVDFYSCFVTNVELLHNFWTFYYYRLLYKY